MVMAEVVTETLAEDGPVDFLAPPATFPLLERMGRVTDAIRMPLGHGQLGLGVRRRLGIALREKGYARAIVLPNTFKSALVPWFARIPVRTGWIGEQRRIVLNDARRLDRQALPRMVDRYRALVTEAGEASGTAGADRAGGQAPRLQSDAENGARLRAAMGLADPAIALCPGAEFGPAKQWPATHFHELALRCVQAGYEVWLLGAERDDDLCAGMAANPMIKNLAGRTTLPDAVDLLAEAEVAVTNDSGLMHVAAAVGTRVVAVYGSTTPEFTPPLSPDAVVVQDELPCRPCFERTCPLGHTRCLTELSVDRVFEAMGIAK